MVSGDALPFVIIFRVGPFPDLEGVKEFDFFLAVSCGYVAIPWPEKNKRRIIIVTSLNLTRRIFCLQ